MKHYAYGMHSPDPPCDPPVQAGGNVVRLVGLYHANRGAHTYFLKMKEVPRPGDYVVNLIHYEDAARLAASVSAVYVCGRGEGEGKGGWPVMLRVSD